jgi:hypothetical protein
MEVLIKVNSKITKYGVWVNTFGQMARYMKVNGRKTKCTITEYLYGEMVKDTKDNL